MDIASVPFPNRFFARLRQGPIASCPPVPEGVGDSWWDADAHILRLTNTAGTEWVSFDLDNPVTLEQLIASGNAIGRQIVGTSSGWSTMNRPANGQVLVSQVASPGWAGKDFKTTGLEDFQPNPTVADLMIPVWNNASSEYQPRRVKTRDLSDVFDVAPAEGDVLTWNSTDNKYGPAQPPAAGSAKHGTRIALLSDVSISGSSSYQLVTGWQYEHYDIGAMYNNASAPNRITIQRSGRYLVQAQLSLGWSGAGKEVGLEIRGSVSRPGNTVYGRGYTPTTGTFVHACGFMNMNAGEYLELYAWVSASTAFTVYKAAEDSVFAAHEL
jgi:hypothetical protein